MEYSLTIKDITSCKATLKDQENNLIYLPIEKLPKNSTIGQTIKLQINFDASNQKSITAKEILNELLGGKKIDA